jgi:hypothetical protein
MSQSIFVRKQNNMRAEPLLLHETYVINDMLMDQWSRPEQVMTCYAHSYADPVSLTAYVNSQRIVARSTYAAKLVPAAWVKACQVIPDASVFPQLVKSWHSERGATSSITQMALCRSHQRIIGMGRAVAVPLILADLASDPENPDHWFWALQALVGEDPVQDEARGDMRQMARAWLDWGRRNGYAV